MTAITVGNGSIQVKGGNLLTNCFHPWFGWVWSDGCSVFLLGCSSDDGSISDSLTSRKLGEYDEVMSVSWSSHAGGISSGCFLAVQEKKAVTLWEVTGRGGAPNFTLKRKIDDGRAVKAICWHPVHPIICLLCASGVTVYSLLPDWSIQLAGEMTGTYQMGCWASDCSSLILAAEKSLQVFQWEDILKAKDTWVERSITFDRVHGKVRCIVGLSSQRILVTTDLPLVEIIGQSKQDDFELLIINREANVRRTLITEVSGSLTEITPKAKVDQLDGKRVERADIPTGAVSSNILDKLKEEIKSSEKGPIDLTAMMSVYSSERIGAKNVEDIGGNGPQDGGGGVGEKNGEHANGVDEARTSAAVSDCEKLVAGASDLFKGEDFIKREDLGVSRTAGWNLLSAESQPSRTSAVPVFKQHDKAAVDDSAHVHLIDLAMPVEGAVLDSTRVPGIISPDLLTFQAKTNTVLVGSRSNPHIQLYKVQQDVTLRRVNRLLSLEDQERPVGISSSSQNEVITVLVSQPVASSVQGVFPTASRSQQVKLSFKQMECGMGGVE